MDIIQVPSPLFGYPQGARGRNGHAIAGICYHTMDGYWPFYQRIIQGLERPTYVNSANYSLNRDGTIHQHVPDDTAAWCNGQMVQPDMGVYFIGQCAKLNINPNLVTISIECEGKSGEPWTEVQYQSLLWWTREMLRRHPELGPDRQRLVGHYQIDSVNKQGCPGSSFPWARLMKDIQPTPPPAEDAWAAYPLGAEVKAYVQANGLQPNTRARTTYHKDDDGDEYAKLATGDTLMRRAYTGAIKVLDW